MTLKVFFVQFSLLVFGWLQIGQSLYGFNPTMKEKKWVRSQLSQLSLEQKVSQLLIISLRNDINSTQAKKHLNLLKTKQLGGLILYAGAKKPNSLLSLSKLIKKNIQSHHIPPWISTDHEGAGLGNGGTIFPRLMALGNLDDTHLAFKAGLAIGTELKAYGINMVYAPVLDVNSLSKNPIIGARSFSSDTKTVANIGSAYIKGLLAAKIVPVGKHFPGHGHTSGDSHLEQPTITLSKKTLTTQHIYPFKEAIKKGLPAIMSAHVFYPHLDSKYPATLSKKITQKLLKQKLNFKGLVITDAMNMKGVQKSSSLNESAILAVNAGVDTLLLVDNTISEIESIHENLVKAVTNKTIPLKRLNDAVARILLVKKNMGLFTELTTPNNHNLNTFVKSAKHIKLAKDIRLKNLDKQLQHPLPNLNNKTILIISSDKKRIEYIQTLLKRYHQPKFMSHYYLDKVQNKKSRLQDWLKLMNQTETAPKHVLESYYNGEGITAEHFTQIQKQIGLVDLIFFDIHNRQQAIDFNAFAYKLSIPVIALIYNTKLDAAYYTSECPNIRHTLVSYSSNKTMLNSDLHYTFKHWSTFN